MKCGLCIFHDFTTDIWRRGNLSSPAASHFPFSNTIFRRRHVGDCPLPDVAARTTKDLFTGDGGQARSVSQRRQPTPGTREGPPEALRESESRHRRWVVRLQGSSVWASLRAVRGRTGVGCLFVGADELFIAQQAKAPRSSHS